MKRLIIICEGQTEQEFCKDVLYPHFINNQIIIQCPLIKKSNGGIVPWHHLKKQIETHLKEDPKAYITTLIDYYGTNDKHTFPDWENRLAIIDKSDRMTFLETSMKRDIDDRLNYRFIPYIQLHEFEGLLFNDATIFQKQIPSDELLNFDELETTIISYPNPELINDGRRTAPSKRLDKLIFGYNKPVYGSLLAQAIGLFIIRSKCTRFNKWITQLETLK